MNPDGKFWENGRAESLVSKRTLGSEKDEKPKNQAKLQKGFAEKQKYGENGFETLNIAERDRGQQVNRVIFCKSQVIAEKKSYG